MKVFSGKYTINEGKYKSPRIYMRGQTCKGGIGKVSCWNYVTMVGLLSSVCDYQRKPYPGLRMHPLEQCKK